MVLRQLVLVLVLLFSLPSFALTTKEFIKEFHSNPREVMDRIPQKYKSHAGKLVPVKVLPPFAGLEISSKKFVKIKKQREKACRQGTTPMSAAINGFNQPETFFDEPIITSLEKMEIDKKLEGQAEIKPWSGDYWPISDGIIAARNFDEGFNEQWSWIDRSTYIKENPFMAIFEQAEADTDSLKQIAPSEKYELLIGDINGKLTEFSWKEGQYYYDKDGEVESWMGICHGWAPASYLVSEPKRSIDIRSYDNKKAIHIYPAELKGLISFQWSKGGYRNKFIGQRCNEKDPKKDENGRVIDPECFDANPGSWHIVVVNQLGYLGKNFIFDATYDFQVWNQPIHSYDYQYFNPETGEVYPSLEQARILLSDYSLDKFGKYRGVNSEYIVGVEMTISYALEISPHDGEESMDSRMTSVTYRYDLELDTANVILGGEWYSNNHPDFMWTPEEGEKSYNYFDYMIDETLWTNSEEPFPSSWQELGQRANGHGMVIGKIIEKLVEVSRSED